jgi:hypothetical protein
MTGKRYIYTTEKGRNLSYNVNSDRKEQHKLFPFINVNQTYQVEEYEYIITRTTYFSLTFIYTAHIRISSMTRWF